MKRSFFLLMYNVIMVIQSQVYVDSSFATQGDGSQLNPYNSIVPALGILASSAQATSDQLIYLKGSQNINTSLTVVNKSIQLLPWGSDSVVLSISAGATLVLLQNFTITDTQILWQNPMNFPFLDASLSSGIEISLQVCIRVCEFTKPF